MKHLEAVIFDWAGTTADFGSLAPVRALTSLFADHGIELSDSEVRRDMGMFKKDHIRRVLQLPRVSAEWQEQSGQQADEDDVQAMFDQFMPVQMRILDQHSRLIPGTAELACTLRGQGLKLGSTTGYTRPMLELLLTRAEEQGYRPDLSLCPDDVGGGRPNPWMCLRLALEFRLSSTAAAVKVGDTTSDIEEARRAGMWAVGVTATGNEIGLGESELAALPEQERHDRLELARLRLEAAGAHYVIESVAQLEPVLLEIDHCLAENQRP